MGNKPDMARGGEREEEASIQSGDETPVGGLPEAPRIRERIHHGG